MKPICLLVIIPITIILNWIQTVSSTWDGAYLYPSDIGVLDQNNKLALIGTFIIWSLPQAFSANTKAKASSKGKNREGHQIKNHVVEEMKKAARKVKRKNNAEVQKDAAFPAGSKSKLKNPQTDPDLDPMKCFPKALCGVSSEVTQISKRRKNGLITDYMFLIQAIARNPDVVHEVVRTPHKSQKISSSSSSKSPADDEQPQDEVSEGQNDDNEEESDEEQEDEKHNAQNNNDDVSDEEKYHDNHKAPSKNQKDKNEESEEDDDEEDDDEDTPEDEEEAPPQRKRKIIKKRPKKPIVPKTHEEFDRLALQEKVEMEYLLKDTLMKESGNDDNWWGAYGTNEGGPLSSSNTKRPSPWWSGPPGGSSGGPSYERFGPGPGRPPGSRPGGGPPPPSYFRNEPHPPQYPEYPGMMGSANDQTSGAQQSSSSSGGIGSFVSKLFGFNSDPNFGDDPWFQGMGRDFSGELPSGLAMDETKEILETAVEIGKAFDKPSQCNEIFNGCQYEYTELLYMIDDLRHILRKHAQSEGTRNKKKEKASSKTKTKESKTKKKGQKSRSKISKKKNSRTRKQPRFPPWMEGQNYIPHITASQTHNSDQYDYGQNQHPFSQGQNQQYPEIPGFSISNVFSWLGLAA